MQESRTSRCCARSAASRPIARAGRSIPSSSPTSSAAIEGLERAGYLQSFLFRAARLVVDTGLHAKRWSREQATDYMVATTGFARPRSQREVERYCTQIGPGLQLQGRPYRLARARAEAQTDARRRFDIKQFHEILQDGAMPLSILERRIRERTAALAGARRRGPNAASAASASAISATSSQRSSAASISARLRAMRSVSSAKRSGSRM